MRYGVTAPYLGTKDFLALTHCEFEKARLARIGLSEALSIEEKFNLVLENYAEYESELLDITLNRLLFSGGDWSSAMTEIHMINRRLVNLLSACRLYLDQLGHNIRVIYGKDSAIEGKVKKKCSEQYDSTSGYRVMEALRNYIQHRDLPISGIRHNINREHPVEAEPEAAIKHTLAPILKVERLRGDKKFKRSVLKDLDGLGDEVDIKPFVREYIESLGQIHLLVRSLLSADVATWQETVTQIHRRYQRDTGNDLKRLLLVEEDDSGKWLQQHILFDDLVNRRQWLETKNHHLTHYSTQIVSSEVTRRK